jgi:arsenic resistance protein ArsH
MSIYRAVQRTCLRSNIAFGAARSTSKTMTTVANGDLNNTAAERSRAHVTADPAYRNVSLAIPAAQDEASVRKSYRPFLQDDAVSDEDWVSQLELSTVLKMVDLDVLKKGDERLRVLVLYGSMRKR